MVKVPEECREVTYTLSEAGHMARNAGRREVGQFIQRLNPILQEQIKRDLLVTIRSALYFQIADKQELEEIMAQQVSAEYEVW